MIGKNLYVVAVTRGKRTKYGYGERLKDAFAAVGIKKGEKFKFAKFQRGAIEKGEMMFEADVWARVA